MKNILKFGFGTFVLTLLVTACGDLLVQKPPDTGSNILPEDAIQSVGDLRQVLVSAYDVLANTYNGNAQNLPSLLSDDLERPNNHQDYTEVWLRSTTIFNGTVGGVFRDWYIAILRANTVIYNLDMVPDLSDHDRQSIEAEALFIRALCHFDLVRSFAQPYGYTSDNSHPGIAVRTTTDVSNIPRSSVAEAYSFILNDLAFAKANLPASNSVFASKWSAVALEAAVRFQMHQYDLAYSLASEVINSGQFEFDSRVNRYLHPEQGSEAIFYIFSAVQGEAVDSRNGGFRGVYNSDGADPALRMTADFFNGITQLGGPRAELYEQRNQDGNIFHVTKLFNQEFFNIPILSLTQMMLIRAESAAEINQNIDLVIADINAVRTRAYGSNVNNLLENSTAAQVKEAARIEMRYELPFTGQRLHDLKRRATRGEDITIRGAAWDCPGMVIQFPSTEQTDFFLLNPTGGC